MLYSTSQTTANPVEVASNPMLETSNPMHDMMGVLPQRKHLKENIKNFQIFLDQIRRNRSDILETQDFKSNEVILWDLYRICASASRSLGGCKRKWLRREKLLLNWLVENYQLLQDKHPSSFAKDDWEVIGSILPRRNSDICKEQWYSSQRIAVTEIPWTTLEDKMLSIYVEQFGKTAWSNVAKELCKATDSSIYRTAKQCRERWINYLDPNIQRGPWTPEEEIKMLEKVAEVGPSWAKVAKCLGNRTENAVKNRFNSLIRKKSSSWERTGKAELTAAIQDIIVRKKDEALNGTSVDSEEPTKRRAPAATKTRKVKTTTMKTEPPSGPVTPVSVNLSAGTPMNGVNSGNHHGPNTASHTPLNINSNPAPSFPSMIGAEPVKKLKTMNMTPNESLQPFIVKSIDQVNNLGVLQDLQICLVNLRSCELFIAYTDMQMVTLNGFTTALITLQESKAEVSKAKDEVTKMYSAFNTATPMPQPQSAPSLIKNNASAMQQENITLPLIQLNFETMNHNATNNSTNINTNTTYGSFSAANNGILPTTEKLIPKGLGLEGNDLSPFGLLFGADRFPIGGGGSSSNRMSLIAQDWDKFQTFADVAANMLQNQNHGNNMNNNSNARDGGMGNNSNQVPQPQFFIETPVNKREVAPTNWNFKI